MKRPRILIFSLAYTPYISGAELAVKEITARLPEFDFELLTARLDRDRPDEEAIGNILVRRLGGGKHLFPWRAAARAVALHRRQPYDLVWAVMANQAGMAAASFKRVFPETPFLLTLQEGDDLESLSYRLRLLGPRLWRVFGCVDRIQAISRYLADWARAMGGRCPTAVVPNGVDVRNFLRPVTWPRRPDASDRVIITTSRLVRKNGVDVLIEALGHLPEEWKLVVVGGGPEEKNLKRQAKSAGRQEQVEFAGVVLPEKIPGYLDRADVFVRPSRSEGLGNSFLEAMAAGLPTIGTPVGGIPDFLTEGETGWFCGVDDPEDLAAKIRFIADPVNRPLVSGVLARARQLVVERYNWSAIAARMRSIFKELLTTKI